MSAVAAQQIERRTGWKTVALSDVAQVVNGGTPKSKVARYWGGDVQWLTPKDMGQMEGRKIATTPRTISNEGLANSSARLVRGNSVILSTRAPIGHLAINEVPMAFNQGCRGIVPGAGLDTTFLYYFLLANKQRLNDLGSGTTFKELSASTLKAVKLPLPPLEEQKRIVAVLDQAFASLDRARAHAEANLADADCLFSAGLETVFSRYARDGTSTRLGAVCEFENGDRGKNYPGRKAFVPEGIPFINAGHLDSGVIAWDAMNYIPRGSYEKLSKGKVQEGDVLFCLRGSLGKFGKIDRGEPGAIASSLVIVRAGPSIKTDYLCMYFKSETCEQMISRHAGGAAQPNLSAADLKKFELTLPTVEDQLKAIEMHDVLLMTTSSLKKRCVNKLAALAALRQSLLKKAFAGELA